MERHLSYIPLLITSSLFSSSLSKHSPNYMYHLSLELLLLSSDNNKSQVGQKTTKQCVIIWYVSCEYQNIVSTDGKSCPKLIHVQILQFTCAESRIVNRSQFDIFLKKSCMEALRHAQANDLLTSKQSTKPELLISNEVRPLANHTCPVKTDQPFNWAK